jgi:hypothetical protein
MKLGWRTGVLVLLVLIAGYLGFFAAEGALARYPLASGPGPRRGVRGAYHVHSNRSSDGHGTPEQIAAAARAADLDFVVLTDHNVDALAPPKFVEGVLLISAEELSTPDGHLVALGASRALTPEERGHDAIARVRSLGGAAVLAHPVQKKCPWTNWEAAPDAAGLELYSGDSMFRAALTRPIVWLGPALIAGWVQPQHGLEMLVQPEPAVTAKLLALSQATPKVALCAHDAHGDVPYEWVFRAMSMSLPVATERLDASPEVAQRQVFAGLEGGEAYCVFQDLAPGDGFALEGLGAGRSLKRGQMAHIQVPTARPLRVRLQATGGVHVGSDGWSIVADSVGAAQVEVWTEVPYAGVGSQWKPWLVASPIRVDE